VARRTDTVVKARYSRGVASAIRLAKGHVRYAVHRPNEQGRRQYRELWDRDGRISRQTGYERLDDARPADYVYRLTLSPHPEHQDLNRRLDLQAWTRSMMRQLEEQADQQLVWFAAAHEHSDHRHIHVVAVTGRRLEVPDFQALREAGDNHALVQQRARAGERSVAGEQGMRRPVTGHDLERDRGRPLVHMGSAEAAAAEVPT
jgi:hypothetical protein